MRFSEGGDVNIPQFLAAILGEPLYAMVQNLGQADSGIHTFPPAVSSAVAVAGLHDRSATRAGY